MKTVVWVLIVISLFSCIIGQDDYGDDFQQRNQNFQGGNGDSFAFASASSSSSSSGMASASASSSSQSFAPNFAQAFVNLPGMNQIQVPRESFSYESPSPPPPPSCNVEYQEKPQMCCPGNRVICVDQQSQFGGKHPCDVALNDNSNIYKNILCMQYTCKDSLKVGDEVRNDLTCKAVFYDPGSHLAVDPLQYHRESDPCANCQRNSMFGKKVCCGGKEFENMCLATCQKMNVHCQTGTCPQNENPAECVGKCFQHNQTDPYCCDDNEYTNKCAASCFYKQDFDSKCKQKQYVGDTCMKSSNYVVEPPSPPPAPVQADQDDEPKQILFDVLIEGLHKMQIDGGHSAFSINVNNGGK